MPQWLTALLGVILGGSLTLAAEFLKHRWKTSERYQELLAEKRLIACSELFGKCVELEAHISAIQYGVEPLRWPKNKNITPDPSEEDMERAKRVHEHLGNLAYFAAVNEIFLGQIVFSVWFKYYKALMNFKIEIEHHPEKDGFAPVALQHMMDEFLDKMAEAIRKQLSGCDVELISSKALNVLSTEGGTLTKDLLANAKNEIEGNNTPKK